MTQYLVRDLRELPSGFSAGCVTIGNFDGVHRGHQRIVSTVVSQARAHRGPALVFTFDPHPIQLLRPQLAPVALTTTGRKAELLRRLGVDLVVAYPTDFQFLGLSPEACFAEIVRGRLNARALVEGPNFSFGKNRAGNVPLLRQLCQQYQMDLQIVEPVCDGDDFVSSSRIRQAIRQGEIDLANSMLTAPYQLQGIVVQGAQRGRTIGFPTANLSEIATVIPAVGVYAGVAHHAGKRYPAAINIGANPTFGENAFKIEVHLDDFTQSLYGQSLAVDFLQKLRDIQTFPSVAALQEQLHLDVQRVRQIAAMLSDPN